MSWSITSSGRGKDVAAHVEAQLKAIEESTYQTEASRAQAKAAAGVLLQFAGQFPARLISVAASGHSDGDPTTGYGQCEIRTNTMFEAPAMGA